MDTPVEAVKAAIVEITAEEKLVAREIELTFLKGQAELQRIAKIVEDAQKSYGAHIEALAKKYAVELTHQFDMVKAVFVPKA